jgi:hypothetical protein
MMSNCEQRPIASTLEIGSAITAEIWSSSPTHLGRKDPREKLPVFSDALDAGAIEKVYRRFDGKVRMSFGWVLILRMTSEKVLPSGMTGRGDLTRL